MSRLLKLLSIVQILSVGTLAQFPPRPEGVTTIDSQECDGASLSYKQTYICETTPGVKSFSGFVNLPASLTGESYDIHTFYWYFESRKDPKNAPLAIYLAGGAGESSMDGATSEGGPCIIGADSNSTTINPWSLNNEVNMLYIDQPVQTGFSYDTLVNGTLDLLQYVITPMEFDGSEGNETTLWGTFPSQNTSQITAGSGRGANALWYFMQVWMSNFPEKHVKEKKISFWGNSWAGFYIPPTFALFIKRNEQIRHGNYSQRSKIERVLPVDVMGIANGCIDAMVEAPHYPEIATNNTYGFHAYNQSVFEAAEDAFSMSGGCKDQITQCKSIATEGDPEYNGNNETVNAACGLAFGNCYKNVQGPFLLSGRSAFDMSHQSLDPFPFYRQSGYFNQAWVQSALGTPLNFTDISYIGEALYEDIGDALRVGIENLNYILESGYKVAMAFGDRDYRCNWLGGEATSLAAEWPHAKEFRESGYTNIITNDSYIGGYVRQTGKFSFSRVFQSGHAVLAFQPETISQIFTRTMFDLDVATGTKKYNTRGRDIYRTKGPLTVREVTEAFPEMPPIECYIWNADGTCTPDQFYAFGNGTAVVEDYYVVNPSS